MKRIIILSILLGSTLLSFAQDVDKEVCLQEIEVKAARVVNKVDGQIIFPSEEQKAHSSSGYSILQKLSLPNIRIDEIAHRISAVDNRGSVQLRINGIKVEKTEMLSLDPKSISKIDFINNPGVRYGEGIAYVINIITCRVNSGYIVGTDLTQSVTAKNGDDIVFEKWNIGKSEFSLSYDFGYNDDKGGRMKESADYHLNDGSIYTIQRNDFASRSRYFDNNVKFTYNLADSTNYVFQATLSSDFMNIPGNYNYKNILDGTNQYIAEDKQHSLSSTPVLDLYYFRQLTPKQSVTFNAVGTYINTDAFNYYDERAPYQYNVNGKTYSAMTEAVYENRLKPFILSAGINYKYKYTCNEYTGDAQSHDVMQNNYLYAFSDIKGNLSKLHYAVGMGISYLNYHQQDHKYYYSLFRAKASLAYNITNELQLSYSSMTYDAASMIAMISDATIRTNSMESTVGCPDLKPNRDIAAYERTADDQFIYTQRNQKEIDVLHIMAYANYWLIPEKLSIATDGGLFRCFNFGDDYTHCYTSYFCTGSINAYLGSFTLAAHADNGSRFLEGEGKAYNGSCISLQGSYQYKNWQFSLTWSQPFSHNYKMYDSEVLNRNLHKITALYSRSNSNLVSLNITWRLGKGRKYQSVAKTINLKDDETGIIK